MHEGYVDDGRVDRFVFVTYILNKFKNTLKKYLTIERATIFAQKRCNFCKLNCYACL